MNSAMAWSVSIQCPKCYQAPRYSSPHVGSYRNSPWARQEVGKEYNEHKACCNDAKYRKYNSNSFHHNLHFLDIFVIGQPIRYLLPNFCPLLRRAGRQSRRYNTPRKSGKGARFRFCDVLHASSHLPMELWYTFQSRQATHHPSGPSRGIKLEPTHRALLGYASCHRDQDL